MTEERKAKKFHEYEKYFSYDETTDDLYVRQDFRKELKGLKGNRLKQLLSIVVGSLSQREKVKALDIFDKGEPVPNPTRLKFTSVRPVAFDVLAKRDGRYCKFCGTKKDLTVDHVKPIAKGGTNDLDNLQILCRTCNSRKGAR